MQPLVADRQTYVEAFKVDGAKTTPSAISSSSRDYEERGRARTCPVTVVAERLRRMLALPAGLDGGIGHREQLFPELLD